MLQPAFFAIDKRWFPMLVSFLALGINLGLNYLFVVVFRWGHESLALTTSISASFNFLLLSFAMRNFAGDPGTARLLVLLAKLLVAGGLMSGVCMVANHYLFANRAETKLVIKVIIGGGDAHLIGIPWAAADAFRRSFVKRAGETHGSRLGALPAMDFRAPRRRPISHSVTNNDTACQK